MLPPCSILQLVHYTADISMKLVALLKELLKGTSMGGWSSLLLHGNALDFLFAVFEFLSMVSSERRNCVGLVFRW